MDCTKAETRNAPKWQMTMPPAGGESSSSSSGRACAGTAGLLRGRAPSQGVWKIGTDDPRKATYGVKVGVALTLVSLFYYVRPLYDGVRGNAVWAIMTVVLVFEYTVGGSMHKGLKRFAGTMSAAALALGMHWVASKSGETLEPFVASGSFAATRRYFVSHACDDRPCRRRSSFPGLASSPCPRIGSAAPTSPLSFFVRRGTEPLPSLTSRLLNPWRGGLTEVSGAVTPLNRQAPLVAGAGSPRPLAATAATFSRFIPTVNARFDYGVSIFVMTYSFVAVSGYRVDDLAALVLDRIATIAIGVIICLAVCTLICPVWAGQELGLLTARNMEKLASAVEACVEDYFADPTAAAARSEGYKSVLGSKAPRDGRPPHGRFGFRHPYDQYAKVGAAMRQCACCVEALISCAGASSRQRAPPPRLLGDACTRVGAWCARVLKEASACVATMTTSRGLGFAVAEMDAAVRELQSDLRALPPILAEEASETSLAEVISTSPIEGVVHAVGTLATLAGFKPADDADGTDKPEAEVARSDESPPHRKIWQTRTLNRVNILASDKKGYKLLVGVKAEHFSRIPISKPWCRGAVLHQYVSTCSNVGLCFSGP
uniref:Aluminum-activated malate transporter 10 n=1 Tax=Oryza rufipogon TaxID=4529 RepID=A0A0E0NJ36_ORYRU